MPATTLAAPAAPSSPSARTAKPTPVPSPANNASVSRHTPSRTRTRTPIAVAHGDGIGPEIMDATLRVLDAAGADLALHPVEIGKKVYERGITAGITPEAWDAIRTTGVFLKAPITTPQGGGYKSLNVTTRKTLGLYANVRPCVSYTPFLRSKHPGMDVVIVRENEEDTYGGIEHQQTAEVTQCLKLITRPGCEKIVRHAFEYARKNGRKRVSCFTKDNIMKATDGLFHKVFNEIAPEYPDLETDHWIIDIGAARLADTPEMFDVIVTPNLYGDILSDIAAQVAGSVGLVGTSNIGPTVSMFEAIHGSAPDIAGMDIANPTALILASVQMLIHMGEPEVAERVHNAWLATIEDGVHTRDVFNPGHTRELVGTQGFADAVITRLGQQPESLPAVSYSHPEGPAARASEGATPVQADRPRPAKQLVGVDLFMDWGGGVEPQDRDPEELADRLRALEPHCGLKLQMITNRGVKVWPQGMPETFCTDHWRCRFVGADDLTQPTASVTPLQIVHLQQAAAEHGLDFIKTEHLCTFDGTPGFSLGQGQ